MSHKPNSSISSPFSHRDNDSNEALRRQLLVRDTSKAGYRDTQQQTIRAAFYKHRQIDFIEQAAT